ncbi:hypothetical protein SAMN05444365_11230 [Micromonospora pattaloongensis]|uniref:Uncharacterized protein n=1 Tax=Micromonospora pattaloongensis TaxID=405436 RepID=A0A1H3SJE9_9ACTN|nr:hypothetical protein [Micromonospora pattaloongensis]SDZ38092.1 hypothetical protein SAMN05444365_11230 [Micromonospora pattaloongensis]
MERENEPRGRVPERGAQEDASGVPLTETEIRANTRPPSKPEKAGEMPDKANEAGRGTTRG